MKVLFTLYTTISLASLVLAAPTKGGKKSKAARKRDLAIPTGWYQDPGSEFAKLFEKKEAASYPAPGGPPAKESCPEAWFAKLAEVVAAEDFPDIDQTSIGDDGYVVYSDGGDGSSDDVCAFQTQCVRPDDVDSAPDGKIGLTLDDGPTAISREFYEYIQEKGISASHFLIGQNIAEKSADVEFANQIGAHLGGHTWSHPMLTTLTNEQIVAELGWGSQAIFDATGQVPKYYRPPYGDLDDRVRRIAADVFGLKSVPWTVSRDTRDWDIGGASGYTQEDAVAAFTAWLDGSKSGFVTLGHETKDSTFEFFQAIYPIILEKGWEPINVAVADGAENVALEGGKKNCPKKKK